MKTVQIIVCLVTFLLAWRATQFIQAAFLALAILTALTLFILKVLNGKLPKVPGISNPNLKVFLISFSISAFVGLYIGHGRIRKETELNSHKQAQANEREKAVVANELEKAKNFAAELKKRLRAAGVDESIVKNVKVYQISGTMIKIAIVVTNHWISQPTHAKHQNIQTIELLLKEISGPSGYSFTFLDELNNEVAGKKAHGGYWSK